IGMAEQNRADAAGEVGEAPAIEIPDVRAFAAREIRGPRLRIEEVRAFRQQAGAAGDFRFGLRPQFRAADMSGPAFRGKMRREQRISSAARKAPACVTAEVSTTALSRSTIAWSPSRAWR